jgi:hypothetical protein
MQILDLREEHRRCPDCRLPFPEDAYLVGHFNKNYLAMQQAEREADASGEIAAELARLSVARHRDLAAYHTALAEQAAGAGPSGPGGSTKSTAARSGAPESKAKKVQIFVRDMSGWTLTLDVTERNAVAELKVKLQQRRGVLRDLRALSCCFCCPELLHIAWHCNSSCSSAV